LIFFVLFIILLVEISVKFQTDLQTLKTHHLEGNTFHFKLAKYVLVGKIKYILGKNKYLLSKNQYLLGKRYCQEAKMNQKKGVIEKHNCLFQMILKLKYWFFEAIQGLADFPIAKNWVFLAIFFA
jgi:hypothetical protein